MSKQSEKKFLYPPAYPDLHQKLMMSVLGRDPSPIQVPWKYIHQFLCYHADNPTNKRTWVKTEAPW